MAVDICSKDSSGTALGIVGVASYFGAGIQDIFSGNMIENGKRSRSIQSANCISCHSELEKNLKDFVIYLELLLCDLTLNHNLLNGLERVFTNKAV